MRGDIAGMVGGESAIAPNDMMKQMPFSVWDTLTPTIIWRGSDFFFLNCIHPNLLRILWTRDMEPRVARFGANARGVMQSMLDLYDSLNPRWKAVAMTALAILNLEELKNTSAGNNNNSKPWIDAMFTVKSKIHGKLVNPLMDRYEDFQQYGFQIATEQTMTLADLSKYKYHIDFGGGGGTTWFGTIEKLAMPGVLFHHLTSSKDYYHDELIPWVHYIPVKEDLSNLREMYDWAEANSEDARKISEAATEYIKNRATPHVMKATYERYFIHSLRRVVEAYQPMEGPETVHDMKEWISAWSLLVGKCSGRPEEECELKNWRIAEQ